ncbi:GNAT family N-acetyltransferase [Microbacterium sp. NPDC086615]|uniref:GNAT family N-acetyltransferase n=1 Tax=Microbacterium sp. NPDC086615 TaxID=3154865 RepID=UPI0034142E16
MTTPHTLVRFATPADRGALGRIEREYFPAKPGVRHAGYLYDNAKIAALTLTERLAAPMGVYTFVAEVGGTVVGFAAGTPSRLTSGELDTQTMNLQYLAVEPQHRGQGIGASLVKRILTRSLKAQQNLIHAHIPINQVRFYEGLGWKVEPEGHGLAWLPAEGHLRADAGDPAFGFPLMASKVLRPRGILRMFSYPVVSERPTLDASMEAARLVDDGELDPSEFDEFTRDFIKMGRTEARGHRKP